MTYYIEDLPGYSEEELLECFITLSGFDKENTAVEEFEQETSERKIRILVAMSLKRIEREVRHKIVPYKKERV
tara:strand:+ start:2069 stop:2287 length:219 start_codon:yes stop_codon:yes gene_type:complete